MEERFIERRFEAIDKRQAAQEDLLTKIFEETARSNTDIGVLKHDSGTLKTEMEGARADIANIKATQSDHGELLKTMATKDDIAALKVTQDAQGQRQDQMDSKLDQILTLLQQRPSE